MRQLLRYALVGVATNLVGYLVYLAVTWAGVGPKLAMSLLYGIGATASFLGNRRWTFQHRGSIAAGSLRFAIAQGLGYLLNLALLLVFVDGVGLPHQLVQGVAIFVVAGFLFVLMRLFVFSSPREAAR